MIKYNAQLNTSVVTVTLIIISIVHDQIYGTQ